MDRLDRPDRLDLLEVPDLSGRREARVRVAVPVQPAQREWLGRRVKTDRKGLSAREDRSEYRVIPGQREQPDFVVGKDRRATRAQPDLLE